ncbi:MAG: bifunctional 3-phenylpropionate/cinnamic acid dioxygenase ferredoxin subunit [Actinomycetota bacterium]
MKTETPDGRLIVWERVCSVGDIPAGEGVLIDDDEPIAIFNVGGQFRAVADRCSHADASLSKGYVENDTVACPEHGSKFSLLTGEAFSPPATLPVRVYPVKIEDGYVFVERPTEQSVGQ